MVRRRRIKKKKEGSVTKLTFLTFESTFFVLILLPRTKQKKNDSYNLFKLFYIDSLLVAPSEEKGNGKKKESNKESEMRFFFL